MTDASWSRGKAGITGRRLPSRLWIIGLLAMGAAACGTTSGTTSPSGSSGAAFDPTNFNTSTVSWLAANQNATGTPVSGGTLMIEGDADPSGEGGLDPQGTYSTIGYTVERAIERQLITYPASTNFATATSLVPDVATAVPSTSNGLITNGGKTYTYNLQSGLMFNTGDPVTSEDFEIGLKRNCDPNNAPLVNPGYYDATIVGFSTFCNGYEALPATDTAAQRAAYINNTPISGISTPTSTQIVFNLTSPTVDFNNLIAMPFVSAVPPEALNYVPQTPNSPVDYWTFSDGPYEVSPTLSSYTHEVVLVKNPDWSQSTDKVRHDYVNQIDIKVDMSASADLDEVQQDIQAGTADLEWDTVVPTTSLAGLANHTGQYGSQFGSFPSPGITNPYLVFNTDSTADNGALGKVAVRQALEYAINKVAMNKIYGGTSFNEALNQVFSPGSEGYVAGYNPYPTPNNEGDPSKCKSLLAAAGYPNGLTLHDGYRTDGFHPAVFQEVQKDFAACGVTTVGVPITPGNYYGPSGIGVNASTPSTGATALAAAKWDITEPGWVPDWYGPTNARSILPDLFDGAVAFPGTDWGGYDDPTVDNLVNEAESATTLSQATKYWQQANEQVMKDAAFIPFQTQLTNIMRSARVHNAIYDPFSAQYDITQIWLS